MPDTPNQGLAAPAPAGAPMTEEQLQTLSDLVDFAHAEYDGCQSYIETLERFDRLLADMKIACARPFSAETVCDIKDIIRDLKLGIIPPHKRDEEITKHYAARLEIALSQLPRMHRGGMTLGQAIEHAEAVAFRLKANGDCACSSDHFQLATWLRELLAFREGRKVNQPSPVRHDPFCCMDLSTRPSVTVIQVQRDPGETDEQFRDRLNRAIVALSPDGVGDVGADAIERTVRDAIISYKEQYFKAGSAEAEKEIVERTNRANAWLVAHGFQREPVAWSKEADHA